MVWVCLLARWLADLMSFILFLIMCEAFFFVLLVYTGFKLSVKSSALSAVWPSTLWLSSSTNENRKQNHSMISFIVSDRFTGRTRCAFVAIEPTLYYHALTYYTYYYKLNAKNKNFIAEYHKKEQIPNIR